MTETIDVGGKKLKPCPGWDGNGYNCGRGSPRLIGANAEVCDNCSRGMRKRGQSTREEEERHAEARQKRIQEAERGAAAIRSRANLDLAPLAPLLAVVLRERALLTGSDLAGRQLSNYFQDRIYGPAKEDVLYVLAGLEVPGE